MTSPAVAAARLSAQHIAHPHGRSVAALVARLGAVQAQDYAGAKWSLALRLRDVTDADVERALADRAIVRSWPMRGTLHFVAAADLRWMLALCSPRIVAAAAKRHRDLGLDDALVDRARALWTKALEGGRSLTRDEMYAVLEGAKIGTASQRGYHLLWRLAQEGVLCFGAMQGKQQTFALLDEWLPPTRAKARDEALAEIARRYFATRGPATTDDFTWWTGLRPADAREAVASVEAELTREVMAGATYWSMDPPPESKAGASVHLLPGFDEYLLAYRDRGAVLDPRHAPKLSAGGGVLAPTVVIDGVVAGLWRRTLARGGASVTLAPFARWSRAQRAAVEVAVARYGSFLGVPARVVDG